jgi:methyl-accepting chemotaxis protein
MHIPIGYKFILGFVVVVASVAFVPRGVELLGYSPEWTAVLSYAVAMTFGLILGWFFSKSFTRNISRLKDATEAISGGDLTSDVVIKLSRFPDETTEMAASINRMAASLRQLVLHVRESSRKVAESAETLSSSALEVNSSTEEVAQAIEQISRGAESQAETVAKSSKVIHEMAISIELVAKRAKEAAKAARETSQTAQRGGEMVGDSILRMKELLDRVATSGQQFMELNAKLQQVGKIADFIGDIARQTNLLALNASIEATRAGEYGKGFSVVADEVRKLADGTGKSAAHIIELIVGIKEESQKVQENIAASSLSMSAGKQKLDTTAAAFSEILTTVLETEKKANSIADLSQMQTEGAERMVTTIDEIARVAEDNAASTEQVSAATEEQAASMQEMTLATKELAALAAELMRVVEQFRVDAAAGGVRA